MRIAITGATGNVGTALVRALGAEPAVEEVVGIARRATDALPSAKARSVACDVVDGPLERHLAGCDAVVHLAWQIQPMRDRERLRTVNVDGTARVLEAAVAAGVGTVVHASSVGAYSPVAPGVRKDESWATDGIPSSQYSVDKAACERLLDAFETEHPEVRVARLRPAIVLQRQAASEQVDIFAGRGVVPGFLVGRGLPPGILPLPPGLLLQVVHADDLADAYRRVLVSEDARGAFNVAAEPPLGPRRLARAVNAVPVPVPAPAVRAVVDLTYRLRLQPTEPGWFDMGMQSPLMDTSRIREELGWVPARSGARAFDELLEGVRAGAHGETPPLRAASGA
jgi:UDP-glucose 4-epimerase